SASQYCCGPGDRYSCHDFLCILPRQVAEIDLRVGGSFNACSRVAFVAIRQACRPNACADRGRVVMRDSRYEMQDWRSGNDYRDLSAHLDLLGRKLNVFIDSVERLHRTNRRDIPKPESRIAHLAS